PRWWTSWRRSRPASRARVERRGRPRRAHRPPTRDPRACARSRAARSNGAAPSYAAAMPQPLRVLVVGDDALARSALLSLLEGQDEVAVAGQCSPDEALALVRSAAPDLVLWDLGLSPEPDTDALTEVAEAARAPVVVLVPDHARVPDLLGAGAAGVLGRDLDVGRLVAALRAVAEDLVVVERALSEGALRRRPAAESLVEPLTARELEVLQLLAQGLSNRAL